MLRKRCSDEKKEIELNSKRIKDLNLRPEGKSPEKHAGKKLPDISLHYDFLAMTPTAQATKANIHK